MVALTMYGQQCVTWTLADAEDRVGHWRHGSYCNAAQTRAEGIGMQLALPTLS